MEAPSVLGGGRTSSAATARTTRAAAVLRACDGSPAGGWRGPIVRLSAPAGYVSWPDLVVNPDGSSTATFTARGAANRQALVSADFAGTFVELSAVVPGDTTFPAVDNQDLTDSLGADDAGDQTVLFAQYEINEEGDSAEEGRIVSSNRAAGGAWEPPVALTGEPHFLGGAQLAVNGNGAAIAVWTRGVSRVYAAYRSAFAASWTAPHLISRRSAFAEAGIDDAGNALIAVTALRGIAVTRWVASEASWTGPVQLARHSTTAPSVAVSGDGTAFVSWARPAKQAHDHQVLNVVSQMTPDGVWHPAWLVGRGLGRPSVDLTVDDAGRAFFTWWAVNPTGKTGDLLVSSSRGGQWPAHGRVLADSARLNAWPQVQARAAGHGRALVVWSTRTAGARLLKASIKAPRAPWSPGLRLTSPSARPDLYATAINLGGQAAVAWMRNNKVWARTVGPCPQ